MYTYAQFEYNWARDREVKGIDWTKAGEVYIGVGGRISECLTALNNEAKYGLVSLTSLHQYYFMYVPMLLYEHYIYYKYLYLLLSSKLDQRVKIEEN